MNTQERRRLVLAHLVDTIIAKAAISKSRSERVEAAKDLRKEMTKNQFASLRSDSISHPRHASR